MVTKTYIKAKKVSGASDALRAGISLAKTTIKDNIIYGISGPEIGCDLAFFVVKKSLDFNFRQVYINPKIVEKSSQNDYAEEACFSLKEVKRIVLRPESITLRAQDEKLNYFDIKLTGFSARLAQHLVDHINGITILDKE